MGSSTDTEAWASSEGGVFTEGFDDDSRDPDADLSEPPDGVVDPMEANESASAGVEENIISGDHHALLRVPQVQLLAKNLNEYLSGVQSGHSNSVTISHN